MGEIDQVAFEKLFLEPLRNGLTRPKRVRGQGVKMINMGELFAHARIGNVPMDRVPLSSREAENYLLESGDLLFARQSLVRDGAGKCSIFMGADEPITWEGHIIRARLDPQKADSLFYYYFFNSHFGFQTIQSIVEQVAAAGIRGSDLAKLEVPYLSLPEQQKIVEILGSLDDKIELNRLMNQTLESLARATFKSWFVDFDPARVKAEGRQPVGMDTETAALFPAGFEKSALGEIPRGWIVEKVGNIVEFSYGKALKADNRKSGNVPVFGSNGQIDWHNEKLIDGPGIIVGRKGNPGTVTWSRTEFFPIDTTFYVQPKTEMSLYYLFYSLSFMDLPSLSADSAVPGLNRNIAYMNDILIPDKQVILVFDKLIQAFFDKIHSNNEQSRTLAFLRDALLPHLMNGEVRVSEIK